MRTVAFKEAMRSLASPPASYGPHLTLAPDALFASLRGAEKLLLAVSGGPDSTALLLLIDRWRRMTHVPVAVATVDHGLREGSTAEASAVAALCAARGLPHHILVREGAPFLTRVQERARAARYDLLTRCAKTIGSDTIVTAHHADDQAETILMRLTRGSGPAGLAGMAPLARWDGIAIARPLLDIPKRVLLEVCHAEGASFAEDPSNRDPAFRRVALRELATSLTTQGLGSGALLRLSHRAARAREALDWAEAYARTILAIRKDERCTSFSAAGFDALPAEIGLRILARELTQRVPGATVRLEQLESLMKRLSAAIANGDPFAATLGGCAVRVRDAMVTVSVATPRRVVQNTSLLQEGRNYPSLPALLGKAASDA